MFNRRPDLGLPMDAEKGESIELVSTLFSTLLDDARRQGIHDCDLYFLSDRVLQFFKRAQGLEEKAKMLGSPLEQAVQIWRQTPRHVMSAILQAHGYSLPKGFVQLGSIDRLWAR